MELIKIIVSGDTEIIDDQESVVKIKLIDITTTDSLMAFGEIRIANEDLSLNGAFVKDAEITVALSLGISAPKVVFKGVISNVIDGQLILLDVRGKAFKWLNTRVKKSLNKITPEKIIREITSQLDGKLELGEMPKIKRHSYILHNGTIAEEIHRFNKTFNLNLVPYVDRLGNLILKTLEDNVKNTDIAFNDKEFRKFENGILETMLDVEVDVFNIIQIMGVGYIVGSHRFFINDRKTKSFISVTQI